MPLQLPSVSWWGVIWWVKKVTETSEAQSPEQSPYSYLRSCIKEYCPLSDTSVQQPDCSLYCETNREESKKSLLTPLHTSSRCQVQLQKRAEGIFPRGSLRQEAYTVFIFSSLAFPCQILEENILFQQRATIYQGEISQFGTLWGLRQNSLELWTDETEKDEDQGKAESSIRQAAEVEICCCFVLYLI